ncbi:MAG: DUF2141 domain-containing protein, partial [Cyclobacteriaceae bacterium]|nr:DUF2141 domain-containing protein [Cyclobacteriaceae bacterium]
YQDTIHLSQSLDSISIYTQQFDVSPLRFISARPNRQYFEIRYSKSFSHYKIENLFDRTEQIISHHYEPSKIRLYNNLNFAEKTDSTLVLVTVSDTLQNTLSDTLVLKFNNATNDPSENKFNLTYQEISRDSIKFSLSSTKPLSIYIPNQLTFYYDSLSSLSFNGEINTTPNQDKTFIKFAIPYNWQVLIDSLNKIRPDSIPLESNKIFMVIPTGSFITVEGDSSDNLSFSFLNYNPEDFGTITYSLFEYPQSFFVQLLDKNGNIINNVYNESTFTFTRIKPGTYTLRALIDQNNNGKWDIGNIYQNSKPEPFTLYPKKIEIRANWELTIDDFEFKY